MPLPPTAPQSTVSWTVSDAVLVLLGAQLVSIVWAGLVVAILHPDGLPDPTPTGLQLLLTFGLWLGYGVGPLFIVGRRDGLPGSDLGMALRPIDLPVGLVGGVVTQVGLLQLLYLPILRFVEGDPSESARALIDAIDRPVDVVLFVVAVVVIAPLVEEIFFRGLLLGALRARFGTAAAVVVSAAVFALVHRQLLTFPGLFVFGLLAALLVVRTGRLGPAWAMHAAFNASTLVIIGL